MSLAGNDDTRGRSGCNTVGNVAYALPLLLVPREGPSFECAFLAAVAAGTSGALRVRRCVDLASGAGCLWTASSAEGVIPGVASIAALPELLTAAAAVLDGCSAGWRGGRSDGHYCTLGQRVRAFGEDPSLLGPALGELSAELRAAGVRGSAAGPAEGPRFLGGTRPSLLGDVPLVGGLLTSRVWCRRVKKSRAADFEAMEWPLKGNNLLLYWLHGVLDSHFGQLALQACRGEPLALESLVPDLLSLGSAAPEALVAAVRGALPPPGALVAAAELQTDAQMLAAAERQVALERERQPLVDAVLSEDLAGVQRLLAVRADLGARLRTKHHEYRLQHVAAALGVSVPVGATLDGHPAVLIAEDLGIRLYTTGGEADDARRNGASIFKALLDARASLEDKDSDGSTPVFYAAMAGNLPALELIASVGGSTPFRKRDDLNRTPLYWATSNDQLAAVRWLCEHARDEIDLDVQSKHGRTALAKAAWSDLPVVAAALLEHRADPRVRDDHGRNVLHMASWGPFGGRRGHKFVSGRVAGASPRCVEMLLALPEGVECVAVPDRDDATPMHIAASTGAIEVLEIMLGTEAGRRCAREPPEGARDFVPLAGSAYRGHVDCLELLLKAGADPLRQSCRGRSALDFAVVGRQARTCAVLAETVAERAREQCLEGAVREISVNATEWACRFGEVDCLRALLDHWPACALARDFVRLCLLGASGDEALLTAAPAWPPFPEAVAPWPPEPDAATVATMRPLGPRFSGRWGTAALSVAAGCCEVLLKARACVGAGTLCLVLRESLLSNMQYEHLRGELLGAYLADRIGEAAAEALAWPLAAAANAGDRAAVSSLLALRADPACGGGIAVALASAAGCTSCAACLVEALPRRGLDFVCSLGDGSVPVIPAVIAAANGQASCMAFLLQLAGAGGAPVAELRGSCAAAAAAGQYLDVARWLEEGDLGAAPQLSSLNRCGTSAVLHYRILPKVDTDAASAACSAISARIRSLSPNPAEPASRHARPNAAAAGCWAALVRAVGQPQARFRNEGDLESCMWADTPAEASAALALLREDLVSGGPALLGVDVECHQDVVCTVQLSSYRHDVVLDALRLHELLGVALGPLFADCSIIKVFHAPRGDLRWLWQNFGLTVAGLFDTAAAARELAMAGRPAEDPSLKSLCSEHLGLQIDKTFQRADWRLRPLPRGMLSYAAGDSRVLPPLVHVLAAKLVAAGRLDACRDACNKQLAAAAAGSSGWTRFRLELV